MLELKGEPMKTRNILIDAAWGAAGVIAIAIGANALAMGARPQVAPDQLRFVGAGASTNLANLKLIAYDGSGFYQVNLTAPASLALGAQGTLSLTVAVTSPVLGLDVSMARQTDGSYLSSVPPGGRAMRVWRNGLMQYRDLGYGVDATPGKIVPMTPWGTEDYVTCDLIPTAVP
jgi:hypothetical protein